MTETAPPAVAVLGAGSWGTALALQLARAGSAVVLWGRDRAGLAAIARDGENRRYLPGVALPAAIRVEGDLAAAVAGCDDVLVCVPSHAFRGLLAALAPVLPATTRVAWATKGFEQHSGLLPHAVARELLGAGRALAVLSGPTFAREVGAGLPTAITVAATDPAYASAFAARLSGARFRAYTSADMIGVEVGGAVKNVIAIGAGISDGLRFGANTRIALITRGLAEMTRLGVALGATARTFVGLSGMGDLVLTCTDDQSRNRRLGLALARGDSVTSAVAAIGQVVEGAYAAVAVTEVAARLQLELPICQQVAAILAGAATPAAAVETLMARALRPEHD